MFCSAQFTAVAYAGHEGRGLRPLLLVPGVLPATLPDQVGSQNGPLTQTSTLREARDHLDEGTFASPALYLIP